MKFAIAYGAALLLIFLLTKDNIATIRPLLGADAGSTLTRPWAQITSQFLHNSWFHILYNLAVLGCTMPFAIQAFGPKAIPFAMLASILTGFAVNLLLIQPLSDLSAAQAAMDARYIGASVAIFAGAGMAFAAWQGPTPIKMAALAGFFLYEAILSSTNLTAPFVGVYHSVGAIAGIGMGRAFS